MSGEVHVWRADPQPATRWFVWLDNRRLWTRWSPFKRLRCYECGRRRIARNLIVHAYYDEVRVFCKPDLQCSRARMKQRKRSR